jgi:hypothetical protein
VYLARSVVLHDGQDAHWRQHHGQARALGGVLAQACESHHGGHQDEAAADAYKARGDACKQPYKQQREKGEGIHGVKNQNSGTK